MSAYRGVIAWMAQNPVVANLLLFLLVIGGAASLAGIKVETFPAFDLDVVQIQVPYPGSSPADVEQGIVLAVEEAVRGVEGVKRVNSTAAEGAGVVSLELLISADPDQVLADVKSAVDRVSTFPDLAERPVVSLLTRRSRVISLVISGDLDIGTLHALAEQARVSMLDHPDISQVELDGIPPLEVAIEVPRAQLEALGVTLDDVARVVQAASLERPGGSVKTAGGEVLVRLTDRRQTVEEFAVLPLRGTLDGRIVRLGEVAKITDGYAETDQFSRFNGKPAVRVTAYRVGDETPMEVARAARALALGLTETLPDTVSVNIWDDDSVTLVERIDLLISNALMGLVLVVVLLSLLMRYNLAFWVAGGIPVSFLGAFLLLPVFDVSINMLSLFAFIVTLGMVVDDAIVVSEHAYSKIEKGMEPLAAAIEGAREMVVPVTFSILTTFAAFLPLLFVPGFTGKLFRLVPIVVISVLSVSLLESFFVLPAHIAHARFGEIRTPLGRALDAPRAWVTAALNAFIERVYVPVMYRLLHHKHAVMAGATSILLISFGLVAGQWVSFEFFPVLEGNVVTVSARLPYGAPVERSEAVGRTLESAAYAALKDIGEEDEFVALYTKVGQGVAASRGAAAESGSHLVTLELQLTPEGERTVTAAAVAAAWRNATPPIFGVDAISYTGLSGPSAGAAVDVTLSHPDRAVLAAAAARVEGEIRGYAQLMNVENGWNSGKTQLDFRLTDAGQTLGLSSSEVARQLRAGFFGAEAVREQRGRDELKVMVRLPKAERRSEQDIEALKLRTPSGGSVPLGEAVRWERGRSPTAIFREDGQRVVHVVAALAPGVVSSQAVLSDLKERVFPKLAEEFPGIHTELAGQQRSRADSMGSLKTNFLYALIGIYVLIAIPFGSYVKPLVVMSAIPFGIAGAIFGHLLMGYPLSIFSVFGIVALSGVVVNDSIVLIDAAQGYLREGDSELQAILKAGARRLRPILLTSLTTFLGLAPMILETSRQAQFLIPMALSLGFGILASTVVVLVVVPALHLLMIDLKIGVQGVFRWWSEA